MLVQSHPLPCRCRSYDAAGGDTADHVQVPLPLVHVGLAFTTGVPGVGDGMAVGITQESFIAHDDCWSNVSRERTLPYTVTPGPNAFADVDLFVPDVQVPDHIESEYTNPKFGSVESRAQYG